MLIGVILPTVGRLALYKRKSSDLRLVHNPVTLVGVFLNNWRFYVFRAKIYVR